MIFTSNFSKNGKNELACSIAGWPPDWYSGKQYKKLSPKWEFFQQYKKDKNEENYIKEYYSQVLSKLNPEEVLKDLDGYILLCYEKETDFCHRFIVADWLNHHLGIEVKEI